MGKLWGGAEDRPGEREPGAGKPTALQGQQGVRSAGLESGLWADSLATQCSSEWMWGWPDSHQEAAT